MITSSYKQRRDRGVVRKGQNLAGSDKLVQLRARFARKTLMQQSQNSCSAPTPAERTVLNVSFADVTKYLQRGTRLAPTKKIIRFRKDTADKEKVKRAAGVWRGWVGDMPKLRLGGAAAIRAQETSEMGRRACLWLRSRCRQDVASPHAQGSSSTSVAYVEKPLLRREETNKHVGPIIDLTDLTSAKVSKITLDKVREARVIHVSPEADLEQSKLAECHLVAWAMAIGLGQSVKIQNKDRSLPAKAIGYTAAMRSSHHLLFSEVFCKKYASFVRACEDIAKAPGSKWKVGKAFGSAAGSAITRNCKTMDSLSDAQRFLKSVKRARVALPGVYHAHAS